MNKINKIYIQKASLIIYLKINKIINRIINKF
jgi:hypothetical protein